MSEAVLTLVRKRKRRPPTYDEKFAVFHLFSCILFAARDVFIYVAGHDVFGAHADWFDRGLAAAATVILLSCAWFWSMPVIWNYIKNGYRDE